MKALLDEFAGHLFQHCLGIGRSLGQRVVQRLEAAPGSRKLNRPLRQMGEVVINEVNEPMP